MPDALLRETPEDEEWRVDRRDPTVVRDRHGLKLAEAAAPDHARRMAAAVALRRAAALVARDVEKAGVHASLTGGEYHAAAMLLTAEALTALLAAAALYDGT